MYPTNDLEKLNDVERLTSVPKVERINDPERLIRMPELQRITGKSRTSIYPLLDPTHPSYDPTFPRQVKIGPRSVAWPLSKVLEWVRSRPEAPHRAIIKNQ